jgi:hypothetical protein
VDPTSGDGLAESHNDELSVCDFPLELNLPFPVPLLPDFLLLFSLHVGDNDSIVGSGEVPTRGEGEAEI